MFLRKSVTGAFLQTIAALVFILSISLLVIFWTRAIDREKQTMVNPLAISNSNLRAAAIFLPVANERRSVTYVEEFGLNDQRSTIVKVLSQQVIHDWNAQPLYRLVAVQSVVDPQMRAEIYLALPKDADGSLHRFDVHNSTIVHSQVEIPLTGDELELTYEHKKKTFLLQRIGPVVPVKVPLVQPEKE